ncbi:MAG TPA: hypothetical protein VLW65_13320 [Bryobacteraceae bacterium]|nr:hypothetical protein [Bryobacteraceae bacterium]
MGTRAKICLAFMAAAAAWAQDPRELVRRSIAQDQLDWLRMKDYTWQAQSLDRHLDAHGKVQSTKQEKWETLILDGEAQRRMLERDGKPLSRQEQRTEQQRLDEASRKLSAETPAEKQHRMDEAEKRRKREFAFLSEIPDLYDLRLEGESTVNGRPVWVVSGAPRPGAQPKSRDAKMLLHIRGRMWIDKATNQWAKVEAQTTGTISWGLFLARLNAGASMIFEQTPVNEDLWLPKRLFLTGSGRVALLKRLAEDEEIQWSGYRKFSVDSKVLTEPPAGSKN